MPALYEDPKPARSNPSDFWMRVNDPPGVDAWYRSSIGDALFDAQTQALKRCAEKIHGKRMLTLGVRNQWADMDACSIPYRFSLVERLSAATFSSRNDEDMGSVRQVVGSWESLPFDADSVSAVVIFHGLEFSHDPHALLREVDRVLIDDGFVMIVGFNPLSFWGVRQMLHSRRAWFPWRGRWLSARHVKEWLSLLSFNVRCEYAVGSRLPPVWPLTRLFMKRFNGGRERVNTHWWSRVMRPSYVMLAQKRVMPINPIGLAWQFKKRRLAPSGAVQTRAVGVKRMK